MKKTKRLSLNTRCAIAYYENEGYSVSRATDSYLVMYDTDAFEWTDNPPKFRKYLHQEDFTFTLDPEY
jgi:hypothetical protein